MSVGDSAGDRAAVDPGAQALRQILAVDEFEHESARRSNLFEPVDLRNVRVIERGERLRFTLEAAEVLRVV